MTEATDRKPHPYVFFASEADSSYISGEVLAVLGGGTTAG